MKVTLTVSNTAKTDDIEAFWRMIRDYNMERVGASEYELLYVVLRDEHGQIGGGLNGWTLRGWLFVDNLVVHERLRGNGYGSRLLQAAEDEARRRGCHSAYLDTYSFQAQPFYEKHGYAVFGKLDDFPAGHQRIFLSKRLQPP